MTGDNPYAPAGGNPYGGAGYTTSSVGASTGGALASAPALAPAAPPADPVFDVTTADFATRVLDASRDRPVIVDFWAPWCGPCKQLGPVIEKAVRDAKGAVLLAKMDIDRSPEIAGQLGVQSIPAVVAFIDGRPADAFMGAVPEAQVKQFVEKVMAAKPSPQMEDMAALVAQAQELLADDDAGGAAELFSAILTREPENAEALAGLGQCYLAVGEAGQARALLDSLPDDMRSKAPLAALAKALDLADQAEALGDTGELEAAVAANGDDHQARFDLAVALAAAGRREDATEHLIAIVRADREWNEDGARRQLVDFFEAWGPKDPATNKGRRALSSVLFR